MSSTGLESAAVIEALFLGTGPLARLDNPGCDSSLQRMRGWPRGSRVRAVAYASIDEERRGAVQRTLADINGVLAPAASIDYRTRDDVAEPNGSPEGEIGIFAIESSLVPAVCGIGSPNCQVVRYNGGVYATSRVVFSMPFITPSDGIVSHELGHAVGLCHMDPSRGGFEPTVSVMSSAAAGRLTALDLEAIRTVYGAGLSPGDPRQRFVAAGLIRQ